MPFRRILALSASGRLRRGLSTAAWHPPWAMIYRTEVVKSPILGSSIQVAVPPCASTLFVPDHLVGLRPRPDPDSDIVSLQGGMASATSGDGLLLLDFRDGCATAPFFDMPDGSRGRAITGVDLDPDVTRFVCNPLSGQLFRLPDIDGTKKTSSCRNVGLLTRSAHGHGPPDRYAVAELSEDRDPKKRSFVMRRFLSQTGEWEKLADLPFPLPLARRMDIYYEVLAFAGRLWWIDLSWGAVSADPFSDRPELRFTELPSASVMPVPITIAERLAAAQVGGEFRRIGVNEGRLRYVELSQKMPFLLISFALDEDSNCWTLEHEMELGQLWGKCAHPPPEEHTPQIGVVHPLNANIMYITVGNLALALDLEMEKVLGKPIDEPGSVVNTTLLKPCVLPPWLKSSRIPSAGGRQMGMLSAWNHSATSYLPRRHYNSKADLEEVISMEGFLGPGPGDTNLFMKNVKVAADKMKQQFDIELLKSKFEKDVRPLLASHCLMLPHAMDDKSTAFLDGQAHRLSKSKTLFLSSLDIMIRWESLKEWQRKPLLDFIIKKRAFVSEEWDLSYGNIELLEYDFEESTSDFVRGECDAAFTPSDLLHRAEGGTVSGAVIKTDGKAKLAIIIWKGKQLLWVEVFDGVACKNNNHAEVLAAVALLMKCEEMKIENVKLWSDSARTIGCINGSEAIQMDDKNCYTYLLLRSMHKRFKKLVAVRKSRDLMFLSDQLLKLQGGYCGLYEAINLQSAYLSGRPLFSITRNHRMSTIIKSFDSTLKQMKGDGFVHSNGSTFFCRVSKEFKFEEFERIKTALRAFCCEVVMDSSKKNPHDIQKLTDSMSAAKRKTVSQTTISIQDDISADCRQRTLVVVWDASVPRADYDRVDSCTVIFSEDEEVQEMRRLGIKEINPGTYFHFNRVDHQYK